ncbi:MAG: cytochrome C [Afipia sp. 62-7]|nr:cytochrome c [Afipia sp.]OJU21358.1 MAG: cytochrome C [Afipia sp. 62-7]
MKRSLIVAAVLLLGVGAVAAQQDIIEQSHAGMKANGKALGGTLSPMARGDKPYDQSAIDAALAVLEDCAKKLPTLYPASIKDVKQTAEYTPSPKIWSDKAGFDAAIATFSKAVTEAKGKIKDADSLKTTLPTIGKSCSGCHETFRVKNS